MWGSPRWSLPGSPFFFTGDRTVVKRRLVLLGPPGSGKGTQAEMITRHFGIPVTSPGAILRRERDLGTPLGLETAEVLRSGGLVSDGFPRTLPQAESLMSMLTKLRTALDLAIWLEVSEETVRDRITGRLQCGECGFTTSSSSAQFANRPVCPYCDGRLERRNDDDMGVLQTRLQEFRTKTEPLGTFYKKVSILHRIDGNRDRDAVFSDISKLIENKTAK